MRASTAHTPLRNNQVLLGLAGREAVHGACGCGLRTRESAHKAHSRSVTHTSSPNAHNHTFLCLCCCAAMAFQLVSFGEAMIRYTPVASPTPLDEYGVQLACVTASSQPPYICSASASLALQSVGGDELNVCVATARLGSDRSPKPKVCS